MLLTKKLQILKKKEYQDLYQKFDYAFFQNLNNKTIIKEIANTNKKNFLYFFILHKNKKIYDILNFFVK